MSDPWELTTPADPESEKRGDNRIREWCGALQSALQVEKIFPGPNPLTAPECWDNFIYAAEVDLPSFGNTGRWVYNTDKGVIQRDNGTGFDDITVPVDIFPSGTVTVFYQASAPTGWTQLVDASLYDRALRVVAGNGALTGGTDSIASAPTHDHGADTGNTDPTHQHSNSYDGLSLYAGASGTNEPASYSPCASATGNSSDATHLHSVAGAVAFQPAYIDIILAVKI